MEDVVAQLKKVTEAVERLEKSKNLTEFCKDAPMITSDQYWTLHIPDIDAFNGFKEIHDVILLRIGEVVVNVQNQASILNYLQEHCKRLYDTWKPYEKDITNEALLKYLKDYEDYYEHGRNQKDNK